MNNTEITVEEPIKIDRPQAKANIKRNYLDLCEQMTKALNTKDSFLFHLSKIEHDETLYTLAYQSVLEFQEKQKQENQ